MPRPSYSEARDRIADGEPVPLLQQASGTNPDGTSYELPVTAVTVPADLHEQATADNAEVTVTLTAPGAGLRNHVTAVEASFSASPLNPVLLTVEAPSGTIRVRKIINSAAGALLTWAVPLAMPDNTLVVARLAAGGAGIAGHLSMHGYAR